MKYMLLCGLAASMLSIAAAVPARAAAGDAEPVTGGPFGWGYVAHPQGSPQFTDRLLQSRLALSAPHNDVMAGVLPGEQDAVALPGFRRALPVLR